MTTIILTGYSGLLGTSVLQALPSDCDVICVGRADVAAERGRRHVVADLSTPGFARRLPARADAVIHLAQSQDFNAFPDRALNVFNVNVAAVAELLDWGRGAGLGSFVHASTGGLYGTGATAFTETDPVRLEGRLVNYVTTKYCAERLAESYGSVFAVAALRYFFIYGAGQRGHMLMPRLIDSVRSARAITLAGPDGLRLNPIHASDAARATIAAVQTKANGIFNVGGAETLTLRQICQEIARQVGVDAVFTTQPASGPIDVVGDVSRMCGALMTPDVRFADGLAGMCRAL